MEIDCPSGLRGRVRGLKTREERILADRKLAKNGGQLDAILAACWEQTLDPGPYAFEGNVLDWSKVLQGDRFYALLSIRVASFGPLYDFDVTCSNPDCRAIVRWTVNLLDLPVRALSPASRAAFVAGTGMEATLPRAGQRVTFRLLTGADERRITAQRRVAGERPLSTVLGLRVLGIDGVDAADKARFLEYLEMADTTFLLDEFDRHDCGVETEIGVECSDCYSTARVELPFGRNFFLPQRKKSTSELTASSLA